MDTIAKGDYMTVGNKKIKFQLPILKSGYSWALWYKPDTITVGDGTNYGTPTSINYGCFKEFEECKQFAISTLKHYIEVVENMKVEDVEDLNIGRPNY